MLVSAMEDLWDLTMHEGLVVSTLAYQKINLQVHENTLESCCLACHFYGNFLQHMQLKTAR